MKIAVISDIHVLGEQEKIQSRESEASLHAHPPLKRTWRKGLNRLRSRFWNWHPEPKEACFRRAIDEVAAYNPDWFVANGDYGGDTLGVGISDRGTFESAAQVVNFIRQRFPERTRFLFGDHDLGKYSTLLRQGGIRLGSLRRGEEELGIQSFWHEQVPPFHLIGINSSLFGLDLFLPEALNEEVPEWQRLRDEHRTKVSLAFESIPGTGRILLFCHDPGALAFVSTIPSVQARMDQIERTVLGHLHAPSLLPLIRMLPKLPKWNFKYPVARIISHSLHQSRSWHPFRPVVCPSTFGTGKHFAGGALFIESGRRGELTIRRHRIPR